MYDYARLVGTYNHFLVHYVQKMLVLEERRSLQLFLSLVRPVHDVIMLFSVLSRWLIGSNVKKNFKNDLKSELSA